MDCLHILRVKTPTDDKYWNWNHGIAHFYQTIIRILAGSQLKRFPNIWTKKDRLKKVEPAAHLKTADQWDKTLTYFFSSSCLQKITTCVRPHTTRVLCSDVFHSSIELILKNPGKVTQAIKAAPATTRAPKSAYHRACQDLPPFCRDCSIQALPTCTYRPPLLGGFFDSVETQHPRSFRFITRLPQLWKK